MGAELSGARYAAMKRDRTLRIGLLNGTFDSYLIGDPSCPY
jgi:hypothetical protein